VKLKEAVDGEVINETEEWFELKLHYKEKRYEGWIRKSDVIVMDRDETSPALP